MSAACAGPPTMMKITMLLAALALLAHDDPARAQGATADADEGMYAGVFVGAGRTDGRVVDVDGFSYSNHPGRPVDYDDAGFVVGALVGRKLQLPGALLRFEVDGAFGGMSALTDRIDPRFDPPDETVESTLRGVVTARAGVEHQVGPATLFVAAGLAAARIDNALTDLDAYRDANGEWVLLPGGGAAQRIDPDDSFHASSIEVGWVVGAGAETALSEGWTLRLDGSYLDFGRNTYAANHSGNDRCCGTGSPRRPVSYRVGSKLGIVRVALIHRFGGR